MKCMNVFLAVGCAVAGARADVSAQSASYADSLLSAGQLAPAESLYYAHVRVRPRDPAARAALGRYLGARGAERVGAVLLEEARFFGGDGHKVAWELAPLYRALGDYRALVALPFSPLTSAERAQAAWLVSHPPSLQMADSVDVAYRPASDTLALGRVTIHVGEDSFDALIDPRRRGLALDASRSHQAGLTAFRADSSGRVLAVTSAVRLGDVTWGNVPTTLEHFNDPRKAVIGLDMLEALSPTFDAARGRIVLRLAQIPEAAPGERLATLAARDGVRVLRSGRFQSLTSGDLGRLLRTRRWTLDSKRGELVLAL